MRAFCFPVLLGLSQYAVLSFAGAFDPVVPVPVPLPRQYCFNSPRTVAGSTFSQRFVPIPSVKRQEKPIIWCASGSQTYITITFTSPFPAGAPATALYSSLSEVAVDVRRELSVARDHVIGRPLQYIFDAVDLQTWDAGGHHTTWGVLGAAIKALLDFIQYFSINGGMKFDIHDGANQVGSGNVKWTGA